MAEVMWERPGDEQLTWELDEVHTPKAVTPLLGALLGYVAQGMTRAFGDRGRPMTMRILFHAGHVYWALVPGAAVPPEEEKRVRLEGQRTLAQRWESEWLPEIERNLARHRAHDLAQVSDAELATILADVLAVQARHWHLHFVVGGFVWGAVPRLTDWYLKRFPGAPEHEPYKLLQGVPNTSVQSGHHLWRLSQMVTPEVAEALRLGERERLPQPFRQEFERYLDQFGRRTQRLLDIGTPTWQEDPAPVISVLLRYVEGDAEDPLVESERLAEEREQFTAEVRARLAPEEQPEFDELLALVRSISPLTEDHAYWIDQQSVAAFRRVCVEIGRRMAACSLLESEDDFVFLLPEEMQRWGFGVSQPELMAVVGARKREHAVNLTITAPPALGAPPKPSTAPGPAEVTPAAEGELRGIGASAGVFRGKARVVHSLDEAAALQPGEILVCSATDPNWTPLFGIAGALVTNLGGSLCHAAVVAREYRLPAIVGARKATEAIRTGQEIEVNGATGVIRLC